MTGSKLSYGHSFQLGPISSPKNVFGEKGDQGTSEMLRILRKYQEGMSGKIRSCLAENMLGKPSEEIETQKPRKVVVPEISMTERLKLVKPNQTASEFYKSLISEMVERCKSTPTYLREEVVKIVLKDHSAKTLSEKVQDAAAELYIYDHEPNETKDYPKILTNQELDRLYGSIQPNQFFKPYYLRPETAIERSKSERFRSDLPPKPE